VVEAPFRGVHETKFRMGEERRQNHSRKTRASSHIDDAAVELIKRCRKRRTHGPGKPDRVFDKRLNGRCTNDARRTGRRPGLVKRGQLIVSQHPQQGR
jgi:hypothetical protein